MTKDESEMFPVEAMVQEAVRAGQDSKRALGKSPDFVTMDEITARFKAALMDALRALWRKGLLEHHRNVNGIDMFGIKQDD